MRLIMVRHAQTADNARGVYLTPHDGLSEVGREQARLLARRLQDESIGSIVLSGSVRTEQTLEPFASNHPELPVWRDDRLAEGSVGAWDQQPLGLRERESERSGRPVWEIRPPGGESWLDVDHRVQLVLPDLLEPGRFSPPLLLVGHGRINALMLRRLEGVPWQRVDGRQQFHTGVSIVDILDSGEATVIVRNDVSHLPPALATR